MRIDNRSSQRGSAWIVWLILLVAVGVGGWFAWKKYGTTTAKITTPAYKTNVISKGDIVQSVTANGSLTAVKNVEVGSQVSGIIKEMNVDFNSTVKEGDVLAKIDPATYERALLRADADLANAKAGLEMAQFTMVRSTNLYAAKLISETEYTQNLVSLHQAEARVKTQQASYESAKVDLERTTIFAPISGIIITRSVEAGQTVASSFNTPRLFIIANDLRKMQIEAAVSEADVGGVADGQTVDFTVDAFPNRKFKGTVRQVRFQPTTNQNVVTYTTIVDVENRDLKLRPGMTANATIITSERRGTLRVPNSALRFNPAKDALVQSGPKSGAETNAPTESKVQLIESGPFAGTPIPPWRAERRQPSDEERTKWEASLSPEQAQKYAEMRQRMAQMRQEGGGGPGGPGGGGGMFGGGGDRPRASQDGPVTKTLYVVPTTGEPPANPLKPLLEPRTVKLGISDGNFTEILDGLKEGDIVVTGLATSSTDTAAGQRPPTMGSPFGGSPFGGGGGPRR